MRILMITEKQYEKVRQFANERMVLAKELGNEEARANWRSQVVGIDATRAAMTEVDTEAIDDMAKGWVKDGLSWDETIITWDDFRATHPTAFSEYLLAHIKEEK